jgi:hypothetical protein
MTGQPPDLDAALKRFDEVTEIAMRFKESMIAHGRTRARGRCPTCGGTLSGEIRRRGKRQIIEMECQTKACDVRFME